MTCTYTHPLLDSDAEFSVVEPVKRTRTVTYSISSSHTPFPDLFRRDKVHSFSRRLLLRKLEILREELHKYFQVLLFQVLRYLGLLHGDIAFVGQNEDIGQGKMPTDTNKERRFLWKKKPRKGEKGDLGIKNLIPPFIVVAMATHSFRERCLGFGDQHKHISIQAVLVDALIETVFQVLLQD